MRRSACACVSSAALFVLAAVAGAPGCGYTTRPGLVGSLKTVYVKPFLNRIDLTEQTSRDQRFPIYRPGMELDITNEVVHRFQFTGLLRPSTAERADTRLEGELLAFRRDALRYDTGSRVEEWRLNVIVSLRFVNQRSNEILWAEPHFIGDATYFARGAGAETEADALERAITDLARRIVERTVENW